ASDAHAHAADSDLHQTSFGGSRLQRYCRRCHHDRRECGQGFDRLARRSIAFRPGWTGPVASRAGLSAPLVQLPPGQPVPLRHFRSDSARLQALAHNARLVSLRPPAAPIAAAGHLVPDASHRSDGSVLVARKLMRGVESIAHGLALSRQPAPGEMCGCHTAYETMIAKSGEREFDFALAQMLCRLAETFQVLPGFAFYDNSASPNCYATNRKRLERADGTVLIGLQYLKNCLAQPESPDANVAAVCAHEFGHIAQYKLG